MNSIHRIVTGHTKDDTAIFKPNQSFESDIIPTEDTAMATIWTTVNEPVNCNALKEIIATTKNG